MPDEHGAGMFRLVTSNDATPLANALGEWLRAAKGNPLVPARIMVPQTGLANWLQAYLAERLGVVANLEFTPPARFAWELLRAAQPELPQHSPFAAEVLRWHLYVLLGEPLDGPALVLLREYLGGAGDPLRRYTLSGELALAYERMQGYRRGRLRQWERGKEDRNWQAELWRRLLPRVGGVSRAARVEDWLTRFDPEYPPGSFRHKPAPPGLPAHFACFACANVSPDVLRMLAVAGLHCNVDFYLSLPSRAWLGDTPRKRSAVREALLEAGNDNPLVTSLGGALAEFLSLLYGYEHVQPDTEVDRFDEALGRATLLGRIRDDILQHASPRPENHIALPDASLQFHACHTPLRELETLHDALLAMLEAAPTLQPRDIAVMMPDVQAYRPAIDAVFGDVDRSDARFIPYSLGDLGAAAAHPVAQVFLGLLDAPTSRWRVDELLDVLAAPGVMRRFDLDESAILQLLQRVRAAGVRWGEDERARADCGGYREFSWAFGIDRMLAGFAIGDTPDALVGDTAPLAGIEGEAFAHLDAMLAVTQTWHHLRELSQRRQPAADWQRALNAILDGLYQADPHDLSETRALERVRRALKALADDCGAANADIEIAWPEVRAYLRDALAAGDIHQRLFSGGVTFCGMVPLRVVPFRVICLLGMQEDAFPRRARGGLDPLLADRRAGRAEAGDRNVRADDRLLFLQLLAAARDTFYVSWIGRDAHTNKPLPPSAVVAELIDVVRTGYLAPPTDADAARMRDALLPQVEPLHPFAAALFDAGDPRSYHAQWLPAARTRARPDASVGRFVPAPLSAPDAAPAALDIAELKRFFDAPARGFLERRLSLVLPHAAEVDADVEPLQPDDGLLRYTLARALLATDAASPEVILTRLRARGELPPGKLADAALAHARTRAERLRGAMAVFTAGAEPLAAVSGEASLAGGTRLTGSVGGRWPAGLVRATPGGLNGKRVLHAWIDALFVAAVAGKALTCRLFWVERTKGNDVVHAADMAADPADASAQLEALARALQSGLAAPLPLFSKASWEALRAAKGDDAGRFAISFASLADRTDDFGGGPSEFTSPAVRMAWRGVDLAAPDERLAADLFTTARGVYPTIAAVKVAP